MIFTEAERNLARDLFARIRIETAIPGGGVTRESYGLGETRALHVLAEAAQQAGLQARTDRAANLYVTPDGGWPTNALVVGSHLDSVPCGGNYDGLAGVVAGLLIALKAKRTPGFDKPVVALGLRGEESAWFGIPHIGAKAVMGKLTAQDLERKHRSRPQVLRQALSTAGFTDLDALAQGQRLLSETMISEFWELHIEQGPILDMENVPVGIVTGIRGSVRAPTAHVFGETGHSGTTPHNLRKDAVKRFADLICELEDRRGHLAEVVDVDVMFTCGMVATDPASHGMTTIAGRVDFSLDIRAMNDVEAQGFLEYAQRYAGDTVDWGDVVRTPSAWLDKELLRRSSEAAKRLGVTTMAMPSGAGHDASVFSQAGVPTGMIFVRNQGGSHNPHEAMDIDDFMLGVEVLWETLRT